MRFFFLINSLFQCCPRSSKFSSFCTSEALRSLNLIMLFSNDWISSDKGIETFEERNSVLRLSNAKIFSRSIVSSWLCKDFLCDFRCLYRSCSDFKCFKERSKWAEDIEVAS